MSTYILSSDICLPHPQTPISLILFSASIAGLGHLFILVCVCFPPVLEYRNMTLNLKELIWLGCRWEKFITAETSLLNYTFLKTHKNYHGHLVLYCL